MIPAINKTTIQEKQQKEQNIDSLRTQNLFP